MSKLKVTETPSACEDGEQVQSPSSAGGNVKWLICFQNPGSSSLHISTYTLQMI